MKLRPYQEKVVQEALIKLNAQNKALVVSPTGSGKTVMLSHIIESLFVHNALVLVHRKEINEQNLKTYQDMYPDKACNLLNAKSKNILMTGVTFCMVQSLTSYMRAEEYEEKYRDFAPDLIVVDEAHRIMAPTYKKIIEYYKENNSELKLLGMTATPERADGQGLDKFFKNSKKEIDLKPLIEDGSLVEPLIKIIKIGDKTVKEKEKLIATNKSIAQHWINENKDSNQLLAPRKTIAFAKNKAQAKDLAEVFNDLNIRSDYITCGLSKERREEILRNYRHGDTQVLFNVNMFAEGFNHPETSCVMLVKHRSNKSMMIQMIGRALRPAPNKKNCLIIDFGVSIETHKNIFPNDGMKDREKRKIEQEREGDKKKKKERVDLSDYELVTIEILRSIDKPNLWWRVPNERLSEYDARGKKEPIRFLASGFNSFAYTEVHEGDNRHLLVCGSEGKGWGGAILPAKEAFIKGRDFIDSSELGSYCDVIQPSILKNTISPKQRKVITKGFKDIPQNRYEAMCLINMQKKGGKIKQVLERLVLDS